MPRTAITLVQRVASGITYWDARWHDHDAGKRRSKTLGRCDAVSERQARRLVAQMEAEFHDDPRMRSPETVPTIAEWMAMLIQRKESSGRKPKTLADYKAIQKLLVLHLGGDRRINEVTRLDLQRFRVRLARHELHGALNPMNPRRANATSVSKYMRLVSAVFTAAFDDELIQRNPARKLGIEQSPASSWHKVSAEEFNQLMAKAQGGMRTLLALCRLAALRQGDALALMWSNVRLDEGVLVFRPQKVERFTKRDARVPICAELRKVLLEAQGGSMRIDGTVVASDIRGDVYDVFKRLCREAGVQPWSKPLHTLRKSCIDDWTRIAPPNVVMEWATHTSLSTTMKYYSKVHRTDEQIGQASLFNASSSVIPVVSTTTAVAAG